MKKAAPIKQTLTAVAGVQNLFKFERGDELISYYVIKQSGTRQIKLSLKTTDFALAKRRMAEKLAKLPSSVNGSIDPRIEFAKVDASQKVGKRLVGGMAKLWFDFDTVGDKPSTRTNKEICIWKVAKWFAKPIRNITTSDVERFVIERSKEISNRTFNRDMEIINAVFKYAIRHGIILDNPAKHVERKKLTMRLPVFPTKSEFTAILDHLRKDKRSVETAWLVEFIAYSGLRLGEATSLNWSGVDFDRGQITVKASGVDEEDNDADDPSPKNRRERPVPLFDPLRSLLLRIKQGLPQQDDGCIFGIASGKRGIGTACEELGFRHYTHKSIRKFFIANCVEAGIDFQTIAAWAGHSDGGYLVAKVYSYLRSEHSDNMSKKVTFDATKIVDSVTPITKAA